MLAGDRVTGTVGVAGYDFMEDGFAGENLWKCGAKGVALTGARASD